MVYVHWIQAENKDELLTNAVRSGVAPCTYFGEKELFQQESIIIQDHCCNNYATVSVGNLVNRNKNWQEAEELNFLYTRKMVFF